MSKNEEKATSEQVEQTASAEAPEAVEEQAVQAGSETAAEPEAQQAEQPGCTHGDPGRSFPEHSQIVVAAPQGLNLREGPHVSYAVKTVLADGAPVEILDLPKDVEVRGWALVETSAGIGWVNTNFLREMDP